MNINLPTYLLNAKKGFNTMHATCKILDNIPKISSNALCMQASIVSGRMMSV